MKKILLIAFLFLTGKIFVAQEYVSDEERFQKETTHVILEDDPESAYNIALKKAVQKFWTITPYKYITESEFKSTYAGKLNTFFLGKIAVNVTYSNNFSNNDFVSIEAFTFVQDGKKKVQYESVGRDPEEMYLQATLDHPLYKKQARVQKLDQFDYYFIIGYIQNSIKPAFPYPPLHAQFERNKDANKIIRKKTMLITPEEVKAYGLTEEKILEQYGEGMKIVSRAELEKAIEAKDPNVVYFRSSKRTFFVNGEEKQKNEDPNGFVVDAATGFVFYDLVVTPKHIKIAGFFKKMFKP